MIDPDPTDQPTDSPEYVPQEVPDDSWANLKHNDDPDGREVREYKR